jgi:hypothetical protein
VNKEVFEVAAEIVQEIIKAKAAIIISTGLNTEGKKNSIRRIQ